MHKVCEVPQSATAFASRSATQNGNIALRWTDPAKDGQHRAWAREVQARWKAELDSKASDTEEDVP
ncbi:FAD binding-protein, partial [Aspergillus sclerotialis]